MTQENQFPQNHTENTSGKPEAVSQAAQQLIEKFNLFVIDQYMGMPHFPGNCRTVSDIMEFDDSMNKLDNLKTSGEITVEEYEALKRSMNELGRLTHEEMVERGKGAHLKIAA